MFNRSSLPMVICTSACVVLTAAPANYAQSVGSTTADAKKQTFKQEELYQLVAPIALYPDSLVSQILMASTYPLEVVQAERWAKQNKKLKGDALTKALEKQDWDPSIKSLVNFPQVLSMMSEKLDWTSKLGDAFLAQQKQVMDAIQKLRAKAKAEGNLETNKEQKIIVKEEANTQVIVIESSSPSVVYVPSYQPTVVYGAWPYPAYPPYYYPPPRYYYPSYAATAAVSFGVGVACGAAWGYAWGGCRWGSGDIDIDVNRGAVFNNRIDRGRYRTQIGSHNRNMRNGRGSWRHDPSHRRGEPYRNGRTAREFGGRSSRDAARAREPFRGRAETGRRDIARGDADRFKRGESSRGASRDRSGRDRSTRDRSADRSRSGSQNRGRDANRSRGSQRNRSGAFDGINNGNRSRSHSERGRTSRSSGGRSRSSGSMSRGGSRGGSRGRSHGGGHRGGGRGGGRGGRR